MEVRGEGMMVKKRNDYNLSGDVDDGQFLLWIRKWGPLWGSAAPHHVG